MDQKVQTFVTTNTGKPNFGDTDQNKGECVGVVECWTDSLGLPHTWGNAIDLLTAAKAFPDKFDVVYNDPTNLTQFPPIGAVIVLQKPYGAYVQNGQTLYAGHTGVIVAATGLNFRMFAQNNPAGSTPHLEDHPEGYGAVLGWFIPKLPAVTPAVSGTLDTHGLDDSNLSSKQVVYDTWFAVEQGDYIPASSYNALKKTVDSENTQVDTLNKQLEAALAKQGDLQKTIDDLNSKHATDTKEIADLNGTLSTLTGSSKDYANEILTAESLANDRLSYIHAMTDALHIPESTQDDKAMVEESLTEIARLQKNQQVTQGEAEKTLSMWEKHFLTIVQGMLANGRLNAWLQSQGLQIVDLNNNPSDSDLGERVTSFLDDTFKKLSMLEQASAKWNSAQETIAKAQPFFVKLGYAIKNLILVDKTGTETRK